MFDLVEFGVGSVVPGLFKEHEMLTYSSAVSISRPADQIYPYLLETTRQTLGSKLPALVTLDPTSAALNFCNVWPTPRGNAGFHWAGAILCAMSPQYNPNYGYTLGSLNQAIKDAVANGLSASQILTAIESLENDYNTSGPGGATGTNCKPCVSA